MKPLKFRAWHKKEKIMFNNFDIRVIKGELKFPEFNGNYGGYSDIADAGIEIMQFTGLYDKNGKEIYYGDILQPEAGFKTKISFESQKWCEHGFYTGILLGGKSDLYVVIGNIYENPEILK